MMKTMWQRTVPMLAALTALAACSSTPTVYYQLPDSAFVSANTPKQTVWTNVYVVLAEPLNRQSLLYQSDEPVQPLLDRWTSALTASGRPCARPRSACLPGR